MMAFDVCYLQLLLYTLCFRNRELCNSFSGSWDFAVEPSVDNVMTSAGKRQGASAASAR